MMNDGAVLIGFIVTIVLVGVLGGTTLVVFICIKWRDYVKRREIMRAQLPMRQPTRRRRRNTLRVTPASGAHDQFNGAADLPPPYSETDNMAPPPYTINPMLLRCEGLSRSNSRRHSRLTTPLESRGRQSVLRHSSFSVHLNIEGSSHTPTLTPAGSMFESRPSSFNPQTNNEVHHLRAENGIHPSINNDVHPVISINNEVTTQENSSNDVT